MADFDPKTIEIKPGPVEFVSISQDYDSDPSKPYPVLLFVPDGTKPDHWHIELSAEETDRLYNWLDEFRKRNAPHP